MGTSGAYGGSDRKAWASAREQLADLAAPSAAGSSGSGPDDDAPVAQLWSTIAEALEGEDSDLVGPPPTLDSYPLTDLIPALSGRRPSGRGRGAGGGGGVVAAETSSSGRRGSGSSRAIRRGAARGGAAIGAAYALRQGDAGALADLGLDLDDLRALSPVRQCMRILDVVLGEGGHPDEHALRRAVAAAIKEVLQADQAPGELDALRSFAGSFVFQVALVELRRELTSGQVTPGEAAQWESRMRRWVERRMRLVRFPAGGRLPIARFREAAARLAQEGIRVLRAGLQAT